MNSLYSQKKQEVLNQLKNFLTQIYKIEKEIGIEFDKNLKNKILNSISNIEKEKFSIALFGAFSDGKSTILAALTKSLDIKISVEPTTDEIATYNYGDYFIVDTPGLFSEELMHEEKTKKYISEANVILYVVDAVNPLKESHHKTLKWLLKDLDKIDSTIFIINKMDEVADLEDEEDFKNNCEIKKKVVKDVLKEVVGIYDFNRIICMSGDPFGLGLKEWFNKENDYRRLSRITDLEHTINEFIEKAKEELLIKSGLSVIKDSVTNILTDFKYLHKDLENEINLFNNQINEYENKFYILQKNINRGYDNIKQDVLSLRDDILQEFETASDIESLIAIYNRKIGKDGYIIAEKIDLIIRKHTESLIYETKKFLKNLEESVEYHSQLFEKFIHQSKHATQILGKLPTRQLANVILKIRDITKLPIKFKPWGALKVAKIIKNLPIFFEIIEFVSKIIEKRIFNKKKKETIEGIEKFFKEFLKEFTIEEYTNTYFPYFKEIEKMLINLKNHRDNIYKNIDKIEKVTLSLKKLSNMI